MWDEYKSGDGLRGGGTHTYCVRLPERASQAVDLRLTLVWTDPPAMLSSTTQLVNDLDLRISDRENSEIFPRFGRDGCARRTACHRSP